MATASDITAPGYRLFVAADHSLSPPVAAVESAACVIAQINPKMPWTRGDSEIPVSAVTCFVEEPEELSALAPEAPDAAALEIGRNAASLINDGDTLQLGIGTVPDAVRAALA